MSYRAWRKAHGVQHAHCPLDCEHPQPFVAFTGDLLCGRCFFIEKKITKMVPCTPDICE